MTGPLRTLGALAGVGTVVAGVAARGVNGAVTCCPHGVGREARCGIGMAGAALDARHGNVWRRGLSSCVRAVVTIRAIGVGRGMDVGATGPGDIAATHSSRVAGHAILAIGRDVPWEVGGAVGALGALRGVGAIVAGVAATGADCGVTCCPHGVGGEAWRSIDVAVAALDARHRNVGRRGVAGRGGAVVAA